MNRRKRLQQLLRVGDLRHREVAAEAGCCRSYISLMTSGRRPVSDSVLAAAEELAREQARELLGVD